jgi:PAP2 superfamily
MRMLRSSRPEAARSGRCPQHADLYFRRVRRSSVRKGVLRAAAWGVVASGVAAPLVRKRLSAPPIAVQAVAFAAPFGLCVAVRRSRTRDVTVCALQMWAYLAAYKSPHDDPAEQERRVHVDYPIIADRILGLGELPSRRLQRALAREPVPGARWGVLDRVLVWAHWMWFMVPHGTILYILVRDPARFPRAAVMTYAVFDIGASVYWLLPTAPPWYAASMAVDGREQDPVVRRMMVEYGELFWKDGWGSLYSVFGGNPLAAMPSLHFATSVMAALLLAEVGPVAGALGFSYAAALGFALVYLGEHYVVDLLAGAALTGAVRRLEPRARPAVELVGRAVGALGAMAHEAS